MKLNSDHIDVLLFIALHDDESEQWGDLRGPITTNGIARRFAASHGRDAPTGLILYRLERQGLVERVDRSLLRSNVPGSPSPQPWCQPWRLTAKGRATQNWPGVSTH